jgi:hypothetical protein
MSALYEIVDRLLAMDAEIADAEGALTPEAEEALAALEGSLEQKCENVYAFILEQEALAEVRAREAQRLQALARAGKNRAQGLSSWITDQLLRLGPGKSVQTRLGRLAPQRSGTPSLTQITATEALPAEYRRVSIEPDRARALELYREVYAAQVNGLKGKALEEAKPRARAAAAQAVRDVGFEARHNFHLRAFS